MACKINFAEVFNKPDEEIISEFLRYDMEDTIRALPSEGSPRENRLKRQIATRDKKIQKLLTPEGIMDLHASNIASKKNLKEIVGDVSIDTSSRSQIRSIQNTFFNGLEIGMVWMIERFRSEFNREMIRKIDGDLNDIVYDYWKENIQSAVDFMLSNDMYKGQLKETKELREKLNSGYLSDSEFAFLKGELNTFYYGLLRNYGFLSNRVLSKVRFSNLDINDSQAKMVDAYLRYITATNMDNLLSMEFKHIGIGQSHYGLNYDPKLEKYSIKKGSSVATSWATEDDAIPVDDSFKLAIETLPFYDGKEKTLKNGSIDIRTINSWNSRLYSFANYGIVGDLVYNRRGYDTNERALLKFEEDWYNVFGERPLERYFGEDYEKITLKQLIELAPTNPTFFIPAIYAVMANDDRIYSKLSYNVEAPNRFSVSSNHRDSVYSLFRGAFDLSNPDSYINAAIVRDSNQNVIGFNYPKADNLSFFSLIAQLGTTEFNGILGIDMRNGDLKNYSLDYGRGNYYRFSRSLSLRLHPSIFKERHSNLTLSLGEGSYESTIESYSSKAKLSTYRNGNAESVRVEFDGEFYNLYKFAKEKPEAFDELYSALRYNIIELFPALGMNENAFLEGLYGSESTLPTEERIAGGKAELLEGFARLVYIAQVQEKLKDIKNRDEFEKKANNYFKFPNRLLNDVTLNVIEPSRGGTRAFVERVSRVSDLVYGTSETTVSRDSSGAMVNNATSSSRGTKIGPTIAELARENETWAGFDIAKLYTETLKVRDIVGAKTKTATKATPAETTIYRYLHGFWARMYNIQFETKSAVRGSSGLTVHHAVNSDKPNLPVSRISGYGKIPFSDENGEQKEAELYDLLNPFGLSKIKDEERAAESLSRFKPIIKQRFRDTVGKINADAFNNIAKNLALISATLVRENGVAVILNPYSNFQELNEYLIERVIAEGRDFSDVWSELQGLMNGAVKTLASEGQQVEFNPLVFAVHDKSMSVVMNPILVDEIFRYGAEGYLDHASMRLNYNRDNFFNGYNILLSNGQIIENHGRILGLQTMDEYFDSLDDLQVTGMLKDMGNDGIHLDHPNMPSSKIVAAFIRDQKTLGWADGLGRTIFAKIRQTTGEGTYESKIYNMQYFSESKEDSRFITLKKYLTQHGLFSDNLDPTNPAFSIRAYVQALNEHWGEAVRMRSAERVRNTLIGILRREGFKLSEEEAQAFIEDNPEFAGRNVNYAYLKSLSYKQLLDLFKNLEIDPNSIVVKSRNFKKQDYLDFLEKEYAKSGLPKKKKGDVKPIFELEYNPAIIKFYMTDALFSEQLNTVSSGLAYNLASRYSPEMDVRTFHAFVAGQRTKRNIANSGTKMLHTRNQIDGPSNRIRLAVIGDRKSPVYNLYGDNSKGDKNVNVWDGGTFISPIQRNLEKSSLRHNADGRDAKSLGSSVDKNGNGVLWKSAWFVIDNERIRMSRPMQRLAKMMHNKEIEGLQKTENGESVVDLFSEGATIYGGAFGFSGNNGNIRLKEVYVYRDGEYYSRTDFRTNKDGTVSFEETPVKVENDSIKKDRRRTTAVTTKKPIRSIYNVWELFGGAYSASIKDGVLTHIDDNTSWENATLVTIYYGKPVEYEKTELVGLTRKIEVLPKKIVSQEDVHTPFRDTLIGHVATAGAIKRGAVNINPADVIYDDNGELSTMEIVNNDMGLQNNPMHYSDEDHISLMTQVMNTLSARGYSVRQTDLLYQALASLSAANNRALYKALEEGNYNAFLDEFERITAQTIISDNDNANTIAGAYAELIRPESGRVVDLKKVSENLAVPPNYMGHLFSKMAAKFTDKSIKLKFNGSMLVLTPSDGIFMMRGDRLSTSKECISESDSIMPNRYYEKDNNAIILAQKKEPALSSIAEIRIDEPFRIEDKDGKKVETPFEQRITHPSQYSIVRNFLQENPGLVIKRNVLEERDLAPISHLIKTTDGSIFSYWEVDAVRRGIQIFNDNETFEFNGELKTWKEYFFDQNQDALDAICKELGIRGVVADFDGPAKKWMKRVKQESLQSSHQRISDGRGAIVSIYGQEYVIESVDIRPYEAVSTELYTRALDIETNAQVSDIENNPFYYIERDLEKLEKKIYDPVSKEAYDIKLPGRINRYFIIDNPLNVSRDVVAKNKLVEISCEYEQDGDVVYRVLNGKRLYSVPYTVSEDGKIIADHRVFKDKHGMEIIMTSSVAPFLNSMKYSNIQFSSEVETNKAKTEFLLKFLVDVAKTGKFTSEAIEKIDGFIDYTGIDRSLLGLEVDKKAGTITSSGILASYDVASKNEAIKKALDGAAKKIPESNRFLLDEINKAFEQIVEAKKNGEDVNSVIEKLKNKQVKSLLHTGIKKHTSFLRSLEGVASRTPAQSHQSFMPMKVVGFDKAKTNNIYVNRWQQYLQGSDYDVDKANFLGYAFKNGLYQGWSSFMDLSSIAHLRASETLPFPTGFTLHKRGENTGFRMDLEISIIASESPQGLRLTFKNTAGLVIVLNDNYEIDGSKSSYNGEAISFDNRVEIHPLDQLALKQFLFERGNAQTLNSISIENNIPINMMDHASLETAFANAVAGIIGVENEGEMSFNSTPGNLMLLSKVIQMYNEMGAVQSSDAAVNFLYDLVNKHNTSFISDPDSLAPALENFVSAAALNISKDPANLMQATTSIDSGVNAIKEEANSTKLAKQSDYFDSNTSMSKIRQQELNLGGMDNTSIVASYMKTFEAMAHANYMLLKRHRKGDVVSPLFDVSVLGQRKRLLANSYLKITDYRTAELDQALSEVDNVSDAYLRFSEFLSLSTDNAKDPTLVKLNADSKMIGLYLAGFTLGYDLNTLKSIITSDLGMKIRERMSENIFYGNDAAFTVTDAVNALSTGYENAPSESIGKVALTVAKALGLVKAASVNPLDVYSSGRGKNAIKNLKLFRSIMQDIVYSDADTDTEIYIPAIETVYRNKAETSSWLINNKNLDAKEKERHSLLVSFVEELSAGGWDLSVLEKKLEFNEKYKTLIPAYKSQAKAIDDVSKYANFKTLKRLALIQRDINKVEKSKSKKDLDKLTKEKEQIEKLLADMGITNIGKAMKEMQQVLKGETETKQDQTFIDDILSHIENLEALNSAGKDVVDAFYTLDKQVQEMRLISSVIKVNQGLENSIDDFIRYVRNFEGLFSRQSSEVKKKLVEINQTDYSVQKPSVGEKPLVDLVMFAFNPEYQQAIVELYESVKFTTNIFEVFRQNKHYMDYIKSAAIFYQGELGRSSVFRELDGISREVILGTMGIKSVDDQSSMNKLALNYVYYKQAKEFLGSFDGTENQVNIDGNDIFLGTRRGSQEFVDYMNREVFPYLVRDGDAFSANLRLGVVPNPIDGSSSFSYGLGVDMLSTNPNVTPLIASVKAAFNSVAGSAANGIYMGGKPVSLGTALFLYNLIVNNNRQTRNAFTGVFTTMIANGINNIINDYNKFMAGLDHSEERLIKLNKDEAGRVSIDANQELYLFLAPTVSAYKLSSLRKSLPFAKSIDFNTGKMQFLERQKKVQYDSIEDDLYELDPLGELDPFNTMGDLDMDDFIFERKRKTFNEIISEASWQISGKNPSSIIDVQEIGQTSFQAGEHIVGVEPDGRLKLPVELAMNLGFTKKEIEENSTLSIEEINGRLSSIGRDKVAMKCVEKDGKMIYLPDFGSIISNNETCS